MQKDQAKEAHLAQSQQVSTISLFRFERWTDRFWAFSQMGILPYLPWKSSGLAFKKLFGSGGAGGFGAKPDFGMYGMLLVWDSEQDADAFFEKHPVFRRYLRHASAVQTVFLRNTSVHGHWDKKQPFVSVGPFDPQLPVAVITRARIRWKYLLRFWKYVPPVSADLKDKKGLVYAVGIGELPWIQQATFSLWDSGADMLHYAYQRAEHRTVVQKTRELGWYSEEMFARFEPYRTTGSGIWNLK